MNDQGGDNGNVHFLAKHNVDCGDGYTILSFRLNPDTDHKNYQYTYECCSIPPTCSTKSIENDHSDVYKSDAISVDRQYVDCGHSYLSSFQLTSANSNPFGSFDSKIKYEYTCCSKENASLKCYEKTTNFDDDGSDNAIFLDRQDFECQPDYGLTSFHLEINNNHDQWRYNFKRCMFDKP